MKNKNSFTHLEIGIFIAMVLILSLIFIPKFFQGSSITQKNAHKTLRENINMQIELFYLSSNGRYPAAMTKEAWTISEKGHTWETYFSNGFPEKCPRGNKWEIDPKTNKINMQEHKRHEF